MKKDVLMELIKDAQELIEMLEVTLSKFEDVNSLDHRMFKKKSKMRRHTGTG